MTAAGVSFTIPFRSDDNLTVRSPERGITSMAEVEAIVNDYVRQAARWDTIPAEPYGLTDAIEARLA